MDRAKHTYTDKNLTPGVTYYYKVRSYLTVGGVNRYSNFSDPAGKQSLMGLTAKIENGQVVLEWTGWPGVNDYRVFCKASAASSTEAFTRIAIGVGEPTYRVNEFNGIHFAPGQTYSFCLRAKLPDGTLTPRYSSNIVEITIDNSIYNIDSVTPQTPLTPQTPQGAKSMETVSGEAVTGDTETAEETKETENGENPKDTEASETEKSLEDTEVPEGLEGLDSV